MTNAQATAFIKEDGMKAALTMMAPAIVGGTAGAASATGLTAAAGGALSEGYLQAGLQAQRVVNASEVVAISTVNKIVDVTNMAKNFITTNPASAYIGINLDEVGGFVEGALSSLLNVEGPQRSFDSLLGGQAGRSVGEIAEGVK